MISFNKGEWSEIYALFDIIEKGYITNYSNNSQTIGVTSIHIDKKNIDFLFNNSEIEIKFLKENFSKKIPRNAFRNIRNILLEKINSNDKLEGSFSISEVDDFLKEISFLSSIKSGSRSKKDITLTTNDQGNQKRLNYSIKSSLGNPPTILNASHKTNFFYRVSSFTDQEISLINSIDSKNKLIDRFLEINRISPFISYSHLSSTVFSENLHSIHMNLEKILANGLLQSYRSDSKDFLVNLVGGNQDFSYEEIYNISSDFLLATSFGMFPSVPWDRTLSVNGGFLHISEEGLVEYINLNSKELKNYLLSNSKFDSPSSKRHQMMKIQRINHEYFFSLNLQVRFKH